MLIDLLCRSVQTVLTSLKSSSDILANVKPGVKCGQVVVLPDQLHSDCAFDSKLNESYCNFHKEAHFSPSLPYQEATINVCIFKNFHFFN